MHIGLFDSGLGGLTVLRALKAKLPGASFTYLGDTARVPYGEKTPEDLLRVANSNLKFLLNHQIDLLVIACSTASAWTLHPLRRDHSLPIIGMIEAGVAAASRATRSGRIGVLATRSTTLSKVYEKQLQTHPSSVHCLSLAAPLLVPLIEEGFQDHPATKLILKEYLAPFKEAEIDTLLLGCTHYPLLLQWITEEMGENVTLIDPAESCAESCLQAYSLHTQSRGPAENEPFQRFFVSQDIQRFERLGSSILGYSLPHIELCTL